MLLSFQIHGRLLAYAPPANNSSWVLAVLISAVSCYRECHSWWSKKARIISVVAIIWIVLHQYKSLYNCIYNTKSIWNRKKNPYFHMKMMLINQQGRWICKDLPITFIRATNNFVWDQWHLPLSIYTCLAFVCSILTSFAAQNTPRTGFRQV